MPDSPGKRPAGTLHLAARHRAMLEALLKEHLPEVEVWAYGSRVNGQSHDGSDLDLVLRGPGLAKIDISRLVDFEDALQDSTIPFLVEARDWARLPERFHQEIERNHIVILLKGCENDWIESKLGDVIELKCGYNLPASVREEGSVPVVSSSGITGYHSKGKVSGPGVVTGRYGTLGRVFYIRGEYWPLNTALYVSDFKGNDSRFVSYLLKGVKFLTYSDKSAVPGLNRNHLHQEIVRIPKSVSEQRAIGYILGALDDKIELNRRMNETLDAVVQALFKSWFVDFGPVRAKMESRDDPGRPEHGADQFPDSLVRSEIGDVPEGWNVVPVAELIEVNPTRRLRKREIAPYVDMANMPTSGHTPHMVTERPYGSGTRFINGDTLVARITPCLENGKTAYVDFLEPNATGWGSTEFIVMRPRPPLPNVFAYCLARSPRFREYLIRNMSGTSGRQRVSSQVLSQYRLSAPGERIARTFEQMAGPLIVRASAAARESRRLADLRDALLPELISGRRRVGDWRVPLDDRPMAGRRNG